MAGVTGISKALLEKSSKGKLTPAADSNGFFNLRDVSPISNHNSFHHRMCTYTTLQSRCEDRGTD